MNEVLHCDFLSAGEHLGDRVFDVVIADPPYNVGKDFGNDSDRMGEAAYLKWTDEWLELAMAHLSQEGLLYVYGFSEMLARVAARLPLERQRWLVWHYLNKGHPGWSFWQRSHESILCLWKGKRPQLLVDQIREDYQPRYYAVAGKPRRKGRYQQEGQESLFRPHELGALPRDVVKMPALAAGAGQRERWFWCRTCRQMYHPRHKGEHEFHDLLQHPTQKPMDLTRRLILSIVKPPAGSVLVPFAGSGSECVVANDLGVGFLGFEINLEYVNFANRWIEAFGDG